MPVAPGVAVEDLTFWEKIESFYTRTCFDFTGVVTMLVFTVSILIVFYTIRIKSSERNVLWKVIWKNVLCVVIHAACIYAALLLLGGICYLIYDNNFFYNHLPKLIVLVLYVIFFNKDGAKAKIISSSTILVINIVLIELGGSLTGVLNAPAESSVEEYIRACITCLTVVVAVVIRIFNVNRYKNIPTFAVVAVCIYSVIGFLLAILRAEFITYFNHFERTDYYEYSYYPQLYATITLSVTLLYNLVCYFLIYYILAMYERNNLLHREIAQMENREALEKISQENYKQMRLLKHDMKNRYAIMQGMLEQGRYDDLNRYFAEINQEAAVPLSQVNSGNISLDLVLNLEISRAVAYGIDIDSKIIVPANLPFHDIDMDRMLTNLLDNSIEECQKMVTGEKKIDVHIEMVHDYLVIEIANTMRPEKVDTALSLETDKEDRDMHGLGSKIVDKIVKKYGGTISRSIEDGRFTVNIMLETAGGKNTQRI